MPVIGKENTNVSRLSSEEEGSDDEGGGYEVGGKGGRIGGRERDEKREGGEVMCKRCGGRSFKVRVGSGGVGVGAGVGLGSRRVLECEGCGEGM